MVFWFLVAAAAIAALILGLLGGAGGLAVAFAIPAIIITAAILWKGFKSKV